MRATYEPEAVLLAAVRSSGGFQHRAVPPIDLAGSGWSADVRPVASGHDRALQFLCAALAEVCVDRRVSAQLFRLANPLILSKRRADLAGHDAWVVGMEAGQRV